MDKLQKISNQPDYDSKASSFNKFIIAVFFVSFVYMIFNSSNNLGWIGLILFLFIGLFASSIFIAMPFFLLKRMLPKISIIVIVVSVIGTFFITKIAFNWAFYQPSETAISIVLPDKYSDDAKIFKESLIKFGEALDITNDSDRNA